MEMICIGCGLDRISDLPSNVINLILSLLPFKDAVRTSALSKNWNEKWHTLPNIIIDKEMYKPRWNKLEGIINYILALHKGTIEKFSVVLVQVEDSYNVKSWIWTLQQKGIRELCLHYWRRRYDQKVPNEVPSILFSCQQLRKLSLVDCVLKPAPSSTGFPSLISLEFNKLDIETDAFEKLISSCPLLEQLTLRKFRFAGLQINVPKLNYLCFEGEFKSVCLNTPFLETLSINVYRYRMDDPFYYDENPYSLKFKICGLPSTIKELYVQCAFEKYLAACDTFTDSHLRTLGLDNFCFENVEQVLSLLSLIGSSENLTTLDVNACCCRSEVVSEPITKFWEEQDNVPLVLNKLRKVRVRSFHGNDPEMKLIQYVMSNSPALEEMTVECIENPNFNEDEVKGVMQLLCKSSTKLSFISANLESVNSDDDFSYHDHGLDRTYVEDSD